jgi:hypothetical protein
MTGPLLTQQHAVNSARRHENSIYRRPPTSASLYVQTVSNLNWLTAMPSYEERAAVEGVK